MNLFAISSTEILCLVWIFLICICHNILPKFYADFPKRTYLTVRNFLGNHSDDSNGEVFGGIRRRYERKQGSETEGGTVECAVCLSDMEEGDEVIELMKCHHMFHGVCMEKWVRFRNSTCPMCRSSLSPASSSSSSSSTSRTEMGVEVLKFNFTSLRSTSQRTSWGLR